MRFGDARARPVSPVHLRRQPAWRATNIYSLFDYLSQLERRKHGGGGRMPQREPGTHSRRLRTELDRAIQEQRRRRAPEFVDPSLILRVRMIDMTQEQEWERLGLTVLASDDDKTLVLFASGEDMEAFREQLDAYARGTQPRRKIRLTRHSSLASRKSALWSHGTA